MTPVISYGDFVEERYLGNSPSARYMYEYLQRLDAKTVVVEEEYVDREFLKDYAKFYSRTYRNVPRYTTRYHFFSGEFTEDTLKRYLQKPEYMFNWLRERNHETLKEIYLGFAIKKPITDRYSQPLLGRTVVRANSDSSSEGLKHFFVKSMVKISLFGIKMEMNTLPFINQDKGVGVCASAAIWTINNALNSLFGIPVLQSLAEITENAHKQPGLSRTFPSQGLNPYQIINYFKNNYLDVEVFNAKGGFFERLVKAFIDANMPIMAILQMHRNGDEKQPDYHAVVITGYKYDSERRAVVGVYVHDDQIGPYVGVDVIVGDDKNIELKYEWNNMGYKEIVLTNLVIPVYPKIRLGLSRVYEYANQKIGLNPGYSYTVSLRMIGDYKEHIWKDVGEIHWWAVNEDTLTPRTKEEFLETNMPRFLWIINVYRGDKHIADVGVDATAVHPNVLFQLYLE